MTQEAQCTELLGALKQRAMTATEIHTELGIARASARVHDLRRDGYVIHSTEVTVLNRRGKKCRVAQYSAPTEQKLLIPHLPGRSRYTHRPGKKEPRQ
ncbi:helix-turn-helix domain-containing protein [Stenotrophomonas sp.]|uniref:helix-turn-helix domain-containing protein n=1 Tax=Stenotrophomonas sp. TaxID=69392 RepID=UPI0028AC659F|nr:helix-turn-helix domain-containing protein [Stenotrophomonas sp.]